MSALRISLIVLSPLTLAACLSHEANISEDFGAAVRHNIAMQTINPEAGGEDASQGMEGQKAAKAIESYREGDAPEPTPMESIILDVGSGN